MPVTDDDAMDLNFETISKGKKKAFKFDKLDIDFNLDGGFDKLSSFKVDMPDLDFSSPSKKNAKAKEKSEEETKSGKKQEKKDRFTFSFDFNYLNKGEKTCKKSQESKAVASESSEVSKIDQAPKDDCITARFPVSKDAANSKAETSKVWAEACNSIDDPCPPKAAPTQGLAPENFVAEQGSRISPEKSVGTNVKETYKSSPLSERELSSELYDQQSLQSSPMDSLSGNNSNQETVSDMQAEVCSHGRRVNTSSAADQNVSHKMIRNEGSILENLHCNNSFPLSESDRDERKGAGGNIPAEVDDSRSVQGNIILKDICTASLSREILDNGAPKKDIQKPTPKLPLVSSDRCNEPTVSELTARKDKEAGAVHSRLFRRSEENKSRLHQPSATGKEVSTFSRKKIGDMNLCPQYEKKTLFIFNREDFDGSEAQNQRKLAGYSRLSSQELTKGRLVLLQSENNVEVLVISELLTLETINLLHFHFLDDIILQANPPNHAEKTTESGVQTSVNPKLQDPKIEPIQNSKFLSEALKLPRKHLLSLALKAQGMMLIAIGKNKNQLSSQKETNSLRNLELNKDTPGNTSKIVLPVGNAEKLTQKLPSLKRKTFEESNGDLLLVKSLKRLSQSPRESRNIKESSERVADKEVQNHKNHMEVSTKNILCDHLTSGSEVPPEVNMTELEFPSVAESDGNVENVEAYGNELEDICNMLKKKHGKAKEILVRAIVNNNNLLILNHPIFKEKISFPFCTNICYHTFFHANLHCYKKCQLDQRQERCLYVIQGTGCMFSFPGKLGPIDLSHPELNNMGAGLSLEVLGWSNLCVSCRFSHAKRQANVLAHDLAKLHCDFGSQRVWIESLPDHICNPDSIYS
ncbi:hypothetical protein REPUB_Repub13aG0235500 [Reevesia pubescens]